MFMKRCQNRRPHDRLETGWSWDERYSVTSDVSGKPFFGPRNTDPVDTSTTEHSSIITTEKNEELVSYVALEAVRLRTVHVLDPHPTLDCCKL